ncbi:natterin-3-like [Poecilia reticulata]|uniref:Natterin-3-like n=1 Tax=Poecilia reticulata TaxID=8081 RepID=A0A3P9P9F5_POERE|nr:PREDICTED: natterin-3-like [Poecilia reticulata]
MLSVLLLLVLSAGSIQGGVENRPPGGTVSPLELGLEKKASAKFRQKRQLDSFSSMPDGKLQWVKWEGFLPHGIVSIYNKYEKRTDYICKVRCRAGFYNPSKGPYCHYPDQKEHRSSSFQVLVNEDSFETLEWKEGFYGSVPKNSIRTCSSQELFVGKNKYGLGMVYPKDKCFYLPWKGKQYWYKWHYEVLTQLKAESNVISDVKYKPDLTKIIKLPPMTIRVSVIDNYSCRPVSKKVKLSEKMTNKRQWDTSSLFRSRQRTTFRAGIPIIMEGNVGVTTERSFQSSTGETVTDEELHSVKEKLTVPPNHRCRVEMVGFMFKVDIPYSARLTRSYEDGETRSAALSGVYHGVQTGQVWGKRDRCEPLAKPRPCLKTE